MLLAATALAAGACSDDDPDAGLDRSPDAPTTDDASEGSGRLQPVPAGDDVLRIGLSGVESIDPAAFSPASVSHVALADLFYDGLTTLDADGQPVPALADFSVDETGTVWHFEVREDATFSDGSAVTASDVVFSLDRIRARGEESLAALRLDDVVSVAAVSERGVDITVEAPSAVLPEVLSSPLYPVTDQEAISRYLEGGDQTPNASGDYSVVIESVERLTLERRRGSGPANVVVDLFESDTDALDAFLAGSVDWVVAPPDRLGDAVSFAGRDGLVPFHGGLLLGVNADVAPLGDQGLRRAMALAIDRAALVDAVFGPTAQPLLGVVPAGVPGAAAECREPCGPDADEAERLVAQAFPDGQDQPVRILVDDSAAQTGVAGVLEGQLEAVGLDVEVTSVDVETYQELVGAGQQQLFLFGSLGVARTPATHIPPLFESTSPDNVTGLEDAGVDAALRAVRAERGFGPRVQGWRSVEQTVLDRVAVVPLVQFRTTGVSSPRLSGLVVRADGSLDLSGVTLDG